MKEISLFGKVFDLLKLCLLLFADDIVLLAETKEKLQQLLEITEVYLEEKKLILNTSKSVVMVFGRKAMESEDVNFSFKGTRGDNPNTTEYSYKWPLCYSQRSRSTNVVDESIHVDKTLNI
ncbi:uncharacterized protein LOC136031690 [Artemia franciscana]|uniref:uncharacterized protein LOC136031690 n=1 Tax=Artemia franciscana TaxID=6661 RepID=UPI0032DAA92B